MWRLKLCKGIVFHNAQDYNKIWSDGIETEKCTALIQCVVDLTPLFFLYWI